MSDYDRSIQSIRRRRRYTLHPRWLILLGIINTSRPSLLAAGTNRAFPGALYFGITAGHTGSKRAFALDAHDGFQGGASPLDGRGNGAVLHAVQLQPLAVEAAVGPFVAFDLNAAAVSQGQARALRLGHAVLSSAVPSPTGRMYTSSS